MDKEKQIEEMVEIVKPFVSSNVCEEESGSCELTDCRSCNAINVAQELYKAGYRKQSEWISVDERLPKNQLTRVLVFLKDDEFTKPIGFNKIDTDRYIGGKWVRWGKFVTHWMPLPEAPKMKGCE